MLKRLLFAATAVSLMASPVLAQDMKCEKADLQKMESKAKAMKKGESKTTATKEVDMAMKMMKKKDMKGCKTHMKNAMDAMHKS